MRTGATTAKLTKPSPHGDAILRQGVITRQDMERLVRYLRKQKAYDEFAMDLEIAAERDTHADFRAYRVEQGRDPALWSRYPKDPILYPAELPSLVFDDEDFDPMCRWCRARYDL